MHPHPPTGAAARTSALILPNVYEYNRRGLAPSLPSVIHAPWRAVGRAFAEVALFWGQADERLVLASRQPAPDFVAYVREHLRLRQLAILVPGQDSGDIARDALADTDLLAALTTYARAHPTLALATWGATPSLYPFLDALTRRGAPVATPDLPPRPAYWTAQHYDAKAGFRLLCAEVATVQPDLRLPEGYICHSLDHALDCIAHFHRQGRGCVLKANLGSGGAGTILLGREWRHRPAAALREYLGLHTGAALVLFAAGPVIVEALIGRAAGLAGGTPSPTFFLHGFVGAGGEVLVLGAGREIRDTENGYTGALLGRGAVPASLEAAVTPHLLALGTALAARGYRGHLGIDAILDEAGRPVLLELNPRRGAAGHVRDIGHRLFGPTWATTHHAVSRLPLPVAPTRPLASGALLAMFEATNRQVAAIGCLVLPVCLA